MLEGWGSLHHWCPSLSVHVPGLGFGFGAHSWGFVQLSCLQQFWENLFLLRGELWEGLWETYNTVLSWLSQSYTKPSYSGTSTVTIVHREQDLAWAYLGRKKVSSR